jgi:DNA polymerase-3 subunit epsilon
MREIVFDTETTGLDPNYGHKIVEIGCVELINKMRTGKDYHAYINPQRDVPRAASDVHGLTEDFLADKPVFLEIVDDFLAFIGDSPLVIHNAAFDMKFINFELKVVERPLIYPGRAIDTLEMARKKFPGSKASLDALCNRFGIDLSGRSKHGALLDSELLADVYLELIGGRQTFLSLDITKESISKNSTVSGAQPMHAKLPKPPRLFKLTEEEEALHAAFLGKIKNPLWNS